MHLNIRLKKHLKSPCLNVGRNGLMQNGMKPEMGAITPFVVLLAVESV